MGSRKTAGEWAAIVGDYAQSELSRKSYSEKFGVSYKLLCKAIQRFSPDGCGIKRVSKASTPSVNFIELLPSKKESVSSMNTMTGPYRLELELDSSIIIRIR